MTKKSRTVIFAVFITLFALTTPAVIFRSQGYRFDFASRKVVQTGSLYFKISPRAADVYVNGKLMKTTSVFTNSALVENLLPRTYSVEIRKQGFHAWQKNLEVREKQVTEAKNMLLLPLDPGFSLLSSDYEEINQATSSIITASATSSDKKKVIEASEHELWVYFVQPKGEEDLNGFDNRVFLNRFSSEIGKVFWLNDYYLLFNVGNKIKVTEIDDRDKINMVDLAEFENPEIFWDKEKARLYVLSLNELYVSEKLLP